MGIPLFKIRDLVRKQEIHVLSSNFQLYGDMSNRIMSALQQFTPELEIYSIDEAFLHLEGVIKGDIKEYGNHIRDTLYRWTGIPVSVGIALTKTLAKVATEIAKKNKQAAVLLNATDIQQALHKIPVKEVWGIGRNLSISLQSSGVENAGQLSQRQDGWVKKKYGVTMLRKVYELRGIPCGLDDSIPATKKSIIVSRSFGKAVISLEELKEAVAFFIARAAHKMRQQGSLTRTFYVSLRTNKFTEKEYYHNYVMQQLPYYTDDTLDLIHNAHLALGKIFIAGRQYKKCGVMLVDFISKPHEQHSLFDTRDPIILKRRQLLQQATDKINDAWGDNTIIYGAQGLKPAWKGKSDNCSPRYTTRWGELMKVT
jgi:DNA polymerase V